MTASRKTVDGWITRAKKAKCKYIISVCDIFDYDDFPVYCADIDEVIERHAHYDGKPMIRINEIIKIDGDIVTENLTITTLF